MKLHWDSMGRLGALFAALLAPCASTAAEAARPNLLLAIADDWSYPHASAYGCRWVKTPAFDRIAREGLLFTRAYTPNAKCAPSRSCLLTGRNSWQLKEAANHVCFFPVEFMTYPEALAANGYFCGKTAKGWGPGVAREADGKPRPLVGRAFDKRTAPPPAKGISNNDYAANFGDFLDGAPKDQPWCFWYGAIEPHRAYEEGAGVAKGGKQLSDVDRVPPYWPDTDLVRRDLLDYAFEVEHFDRHLGRMLALLEQRGQLSNTLVVVTSDNGMPFPRAKGNAYEVSVHMPLAVMWPAGVRSPGRVIDDYVSFIDFAPTFLSVAEVDANKAGMQPITGRSLTAIFRSGKSGRVEPARDFLLLGQERHDVGRPNDWGYPIRGLLENDWLYLQNFEPARWPACNPETGYLNCDGSPTKTLLIQGRTQAAVSPYWNLSFGQRPAEEFYDLRSDPACVTNLAGRAEVASRQAALKSRMHAALKAQADPRVLGQGAVFDAYPYADAQMRGFYERHRKGEKLNPGWVNATDFEPQPLE
jgi:arylsulfatase A-like enzyme